MKPLFYGLPRLSILILSLIISSISAQAHPALKLSLASEHVAVCSGVKTATFDIDKIAGNPNRYDIVWDATALAAGFTNITGAKLSSKQIEVDVPEEAAPGVYTATLRAVKTSSDAVAEYPVSITVHAAPTVTLNPLSITVCSETKVSFTAAAVATSETSVFWLQSGDKGETWSIIPDAHSATYTVTADTALDNYQYVAVFSNGCASGYNSVASAPATLTVLPNSTATTGGDTAADKIGTAVSLR